MTNTGISHYSPFTFTYRNQLVESFSECIADLQSNGMEAFFFNFMFHHISGKGDRRKERMFADVQRVHQT
jgi:uncharacterized protein YpiB (UPF0302 family)